MYFTKRNFSFFSGILDISPEEKRRRLEIQARDNKWHQFVDGELILKQGYVDKRKGLFPRRRMLLLTTGPRLFYVDPTNMVLKGEIPWSPELRVEAKNFRIFLVHTVSYLFLKEFYFTSFDCYLHGNHSTFIESLNNVSVFVLCSPTVLTTSKTQNHTHWSGRASSTRSASARTGGTRLKRLGAPPRVVPAPPPRPPGPAPAPAPARRMHTFRVL